MILEICSNSYQSAYNAQKAGAHRIELCSELVIGGITPSHGLIKRIISELNIKTFVLIRPRSGDFTYSKDEIDIMLEDIAYCKELGCGGIVSGALNKDNTIDFKTTQLLIEASGEMDFTFHRAFDWVTNPIKSLTKLKEIGVTRVLTSGQEVTAEKGIENLVRFRETNTLQIVPGSGINSNNIARFRDAGFKEVHLSASTLHQTMEKPRISMNSEKLFDETHIAISDVEQIKRCLQQINS